MVNDWQTSFERVINIIEQQFGGISATGYLMSCIVGLAAVYIFYRVMKIKRDSKFTACCVVMYICFILQITLFNREPLSRSGVFLNLDFGSFREGYYEMQQAVYAVLNVVLFLPMGFGMLLLRQDRTQIRSIILVTMYCFVGSLAIESIQYITQRGYFELTDLCTNTLGGLFGSVLGRTAVRVRELVVGRSRTNEERR